MPECDHCGAEFDGEEAYLRHLGEVHNSELGRIEERRVAELTGGDGTGGGFAVPTGPAVLAVVFVFAILLVGYVIFVLGSGAGSAELGQTGSDHKHGTLEMTVLGERVDFSKAKYQVVADRFHFESGDGRVWHAHATGVRLAWGMETLGIGLTEDSVTVDGTTYREEDPDYDVRITVNGEPVDPETYVLAGSSPGEPPSTGDSVRIEVTRASGSS